MKIPVVIVDDQDVDRYLVKRNLEKSDDFEKLIEMENGDSFLEHFYSDTAQPSDSSGPIMVLMDVNMPGRDGFETAREAQLRIAEGKGPQGLVMMMFTSSGNLIDRRKADELSIVKGYISKPLNAESVAYIREIYSSNVPQA